MSTRSPSLCKHAVPITIERGGGSVINIASGQGLSGDLVTSAYGSSTVGLTRFVATAYGDHGVRCNAVAPGLIKSQALDAGMPAPMQELVRRHNLVPRLGKPDDIAAIVAFLASPAAGFITGQIIQVDGGFLAHLPTLVPAKQVLAQLAAQTE